MSGRREGGEGAGGELQVGIDRMDGRARRGLPAVRRAVGHGGGRLAGQPPAGSCTGIRAAQVRRHTAEATMAHGGRDFTLNVVPLCRHRDACRVCA
eukprot:1848292-Prymnesium_polylepis.1